MPLGPATERTTVWQRRERALERYHLEPVAGEIEVADDLRAKEADDVRTNGEVEPWVELLGDGSAAEDMPALEHEHLAAGPRQIRGAHESVVPTSDDDRVIALRRHVESPITERFRGGSKKGFLATVAPIW